MPNQIAKGTVVLGDDFASHRICGYVPHADARGINPDLDVPLITHVTGNLWQGGCQHGLKLSDDFDYVLSLYPWEAYRLGPATERDEIKMYDSLDQATDQIDRLASAVAERLRAGETVLIHCQAGLNRSGLVTGVVLTKLGISGPAAVELLRKQRSPLVLCNETFENHVRQLEAEHHCAVDCCGECA